MEPRINIQSQQGMNALNGFGRHLSKSTIEKPLANLICYRVSQINGCAFCLDMHSKDLMAEGETVQRLLVLDAWQEAPFYSDRERAALAWAEALTKIKNSLVPEEIYQQAIAQFSETELMDLTIAVIAINSYNRINIAFGAHVGTYQVGQFK